MPCVECMGNSNEEIEDNTSTKRQKNLRRVFSNLFNLVMENIHNVVRKEIPSLSVRLWGLLDNTHIGGGGGGVQILPAPYNLVISKERDFKIWHA